jgi:hypothetical protein
MLKWWRKRRLRRQTERFLAAELPRLMAPYEHHYLALLGESTKENGRR